MNSSAVDLAYWHCERITRARARNFYYGIRLLPPAKRRAMCALYAMARRIDDVGDEAQRASSPNGQSRDVGRPAGAGHGSPALEQVRQSLAPLSARGEPAQVPPGDPVLMALADAALRFPLPMEAFLELIEGCQWDLDGRRYNSFDELVEYCRRVAGTIGRLSLAIYGSSNGERAKEMADALGVALQLTNILRDLVEDRDVRGRVYLPAEDLQLFGVGDQLQGDPDNLMALICFETGRAEQWYEQGLPLLELLDRRSRACTATMAGIYRRLLDRIRLRPDRVMTERVALSAPEKAGVAAMALARGAI